jgi:hypothetical protein
MRSVKAILEMRRIYGDMTDEKFTVRYSKRYKIPAVTVKQVLEEGGGLLDKRSASN